ncbi:MAG: D-allose-binding periplasmic protein [Oscillospiraceae bacterium]|jgi:ribose transport system substrate-binding protein
MKRTIAILLAMAMALSVTACSGGSTTSSAAPASSAAETGEENSEGSAAGEKETYHFEIVSKGFQSTYWQAVYKGSKDELEKLNTEAGYEKYTMNFVGPDSESDVAVQVQQFTSALNTKPDAIGLAALDTDALLDSIKNAQSENIPIIGFDSGVPNAPEGAVYANASTDNYAAGKLAAEGMYEKIKDRLGNGQVRIGEVNQDATSESITNRGIGFIDGMIEKLSADNYTVFVTGNEKYVGDCKGSTGTEADADVIIEVRVPSQTTTELCATEAGVILNESDTIAIFGSNQVAAEGIITANETLQVCGTEDDQILAVGFDSGSVLKAAIKAGTMYGAVTQAPVSIGSVLIDLLADAAAGKEVEDTDTGCAFYTAENIDDPEIAQNLYD